MLFWIITGLLALGMLSPVLRAVLRARAGDEDPRDYDLRVYRDQLREVDRDLARGVLGEEDAERVRTEISRRILAADAARGDETPTGPRRQNGHLLAAGLTVLALAGSFLVYLELGAPGYGDLGLADRIAAAEQIRSERPGQASAEKSLEGNTSVIEPQPEFLTLVEQLRTALVERPDDIQGLRLLARAEARLGNFIAAYAAQSRIVALTGGMAEADLTDISDLADMQVLAAGGYVSPESESILQELLQRDPTHPVARYYWGLMQSQVGRPDIAYRIWTTLLREGPQEAPWIAPIMAQIPEIAARAGQQFDPPQIGSARGPNQDDIEAASEMSPAERMEMIEGMVAGLAERLADEGGPPEDWARLIQALGVLGRMDQAAAVWGNAQEVFGNDPSAMDIVRGAADRAGLL